MVLDAASRFPGAPDDAAMIALAERTAAEPLFANRGRTREITSARDAEHPGLGHPGWRSGGSLAQIVSHSPLSADRPADRGITHISVI